MWTGVPAASVDGHDVGRVRAEPRRAARASRGRVDSSREYEASESAWTAPSTCPPVHPSARSERYAFVAASTFQIAAFAPASTERFDNTIRSSSENAPTLGP